MNSRTQVMMAIAAMEKKLWKQETQVNDHKHYFVTLFQDYNLILPVLLLPAFITGWNSGRHPSVIRRFKQFGEFVLISLIAEFKRI